MHLFYFIFFIIIKEGVNVNLAVWEGELSGGRGRGVIKNRIYYSLNILLFFLFHLV